MASARSSAAIHLEALEERKDSRHSPEWLLEESNEMCWYFRRDVAGYAASHYTVKWDLERAEGVRSEAHESYWRNVAQNAVIAYADSTASAPKRITSVIAFARLVRSFASWCCYERKCSSLKLIGADDVRAYEDYLRKLRLTASSAEARLSVLRTLWQLRSSIGEEVGFFAYRWHGELKRAAKSVGLPNGRTPTLPPESFFALLDHSLMLVESGDEWVTKAEIYARFRNGSEVSRPWRELLGVGAREVMSRVRQIYGACLVIAFTLLATRKHEVALLSAEEARRLITGNVVELKGRLTKSSNGTGGSETARPTIPELNKALSLVLRIIGDDGKNDGPLFRSSILGERSRRGAQDCLDTGAIYRLIQCAVESAGLNIKVRPHMFRRAFSMIFIWRYELGDLAYLSRFLYHNDLRHTLAYVTGDDIKDFVSDAERSLARSIMERALLKQERFGGGFGAKLERIARRLRSMTTVLQPEQVDVWLQARSASGEFTIRAAPHGYCVVLGDRGGRGACSTDGKAPDFVNRTDEHCAACGNFLLPQRSAGYWQERYELHERVLKSTKIQVLKGAAKAAMQAARRMLDTIQKSRQ